MWNLLTVILSTQLRKWTEDRWDNISWLNTSFFYFEFEKKTKMPTQVTNITLKFTFEDIYWQYFRSLGSKNKNCSWSWKYNQNANINSWCKFQVKLVLRLLEDILMLFISSFVSSLTLFYWILLNMIFVVKTLVHICSYINIE